MKRIFALLLALAVILTCFTACGGKADVGVSGVLESVTLDGETVTEDTFKGNKLTGVNSWGTGSGNGGDSTGTGELEIVTLDGDRVTADTFKGNKLTVVNVWGTFCGPCINEMPDLEKISRDYADKGVALIGIVADVFDYYKKENNPDKIKDAEDIVAQTGVTYMNILPSESLNAAGLDYITTFPTTYFLNEKGEIIGEYVGSRSYESWSSLIDLALQSLN